MITNGASGLNMSFEVRIDEGFFDYTAIQKVSIELHENMHNLAVLDVAGIPSQYLTEYIDRPISIKVSVANIRTHWFIGYITFLEPESTSKGGLVNKSPFQVTKMYCLGSSYLMRSRKTSLWSERTLPQIARTLADRYSFSVSVPNDPYVFYRINQNGRSDWEVLVEAATFLGYRVMMRGTHIDIWDPFATLSRGGYNTIYSIGAARGRMNAEPGQIIKFHGLLGAVTPMEARVPDSISIINNNAVEKLSLETSTGYGTPVRSLFEDEVSDNATTIEVAKALLRGRSRDKLPYTAQFDIAGDPTIQPGMVINVNGYDSAVDDVWIVQGVRHEIMRGSCLSYLTVARDSNDVEISETNKATPPPILPEPILRSGRWTTSAELVDVY